MGQIEENKLMAETALANDKSRYFCVECGRPRVNNYCRPPKQRGHKVLPRINIPHDLQIDLYLTGRSEDSRNYFR